MFNSGFYENEWYDNMMHFLYWCQEEKKKYVPKGICGQSMHITSGQAGFEAKYPTFEDAYSDYLKSLIGEEI